MVEMTEAAIATHARTAEITTRHAFRFKKGLGQNFLTDPRVAAKITAAAGISEEDTIIEIGPGIGGLTELLAAKAKRVVAIEIDERLIPILKETLADYPNVEIIHADALELDLAELTDGMESARVVANLPYYITTPLIMGILESRAAVRSMTVMTQKEVGDRIRARAGTKDYGALTLAVEYYGRCESVMRVPPNCFMPRPGVDSTVIHIEIAKEPTVAVNDKALLFALIKAGFHQRRKTLQNGMANFPALGLSKEAAAHAIAAAGLPPEVRGEALSLADYAGLASRLGEMNP